MSVNRTDSGRLVGFHEFADCSVAEDSAPEVMRSSYRIQ